MDRATLEQIEVGLEVDVAQGRLKPRDVSRERAKRVAAAALSPPRSYPDSVESPLDPPTVGGTEVTRPT